MPWVRPGFQEWLPLVQAVWRSRRSRTRISTFGPMVATVACSSAGSSGSVPLPQSTRIQTLRPGRDYSAPLRILDTFRSGGAPKCLRYSRENCEGSL